MPVRTRLLNIENVQLTQPPVYHSVCKQMWTQKPVSLKTQENFLAAKCFKTIVWTQISFHNLKPNQQNVWQWDLVKQKLPDKYNF